MKLTSVELDAKARQSVCENEVSHQRDYRLEDMLSGTSMIYHSNVRVLVLLPT